MLTFVNQSQEMSAPELSRVIALCIALACAETLHGIARTKFLAPRVGKVLAVKLSVVSGVLLAFAVCALFVPRIGFVGMTPHLLLGLWLAAFMASFDIAIGRLLLRLKWQRILQDFNPASGNYLSLGLTALVFMPVLVWWLSKGAR